MSSEFAGPVSDATGHCELVMSKEEYPEEIKECLGLLDKARDLVIRGEIESLSIYMDRRDDCYQTLQSRGVSKHEDAGRILEFALQRLGFAKMSDLPTAED